MLKDVSSCKKKFFELDKNFESDSDSDNIENDEEIEKKDYIDKRDIFEIKRNEENESDKRINENESIYMSMLGNFVVEKENCLSSGDVYSQPFHFMFPSEE